MQTLGEIFKQRLLAEKQEPQTANDEDYDSELDALHEEMPPALKKLLASFSQRGDKAIVVLMYSLGAPLDALVLKKAELRKNIRPVGDRFVKDSQFRMWAKKLIQKVVELEGIAAAQSELSVKESMLERLPNIYQKMIYSTLIALGMPESIEHIAKNVLSGNIEQKASLIELDGSMRVYLRTLAELLGVNVRNGMSPAELKNLELARESVELNEDAASNFVADVMSIMKGFGLEETDFKNLSAAALKIKRNRASLMSDPRIKRNMRFLLDSMQAHAARQNSRNNQDMLAQESADYTLKITNRSNKHIINDDKKKMLPVDMGKWNIAKLGTTGFMLKNKAVLIKMDNDEAEKLVMAIEKGRTVAVKAHDGNRYIFKPLNNGQAYAVKMTDDLEFPDGILIGRNELDEIIDLVAY